MKDNVAIQVDGVHKEFSLSTTRANTIKSLFTGAHRERGVKGATQHALRDISFEIKKGEFFGIVGRNGSGKSTLLKIIAGIYQPTKGKVRVSGRLVPFIELGVGFNAELTGRENVYLNGAMLGFSSKEIDGFYNEVVEFAELEKFMDKKLKNYSSGMQVRLAFSMAIQARADVLLVDEVLAVGDADFQRKCFSYFRSLKRNKKTVVFVSHDMSAVREYCDRAILIENSKVVAAGTAQKVASEYDRLFMADARQTGSVARAGRWGNKDVEFTKVKVSPGKITTEKSVDIDMELKARKEISNIKVGFSVKNSADALVLGSNNQIAKQKIRPLSKGDKVHLRWTIPNVFNDGEYFVNAAIESEDSAPCDWWEEAARFRVFKETRTGFFVFPDIQLKVLDAGK